MVLLFPIVMPLELHTVGKKSKIKAKVEPSSYTGNQQQYDQKGNQCETKPSQLNKEAPIAISPMKLEMK
jgi:hypothetical protein